uniref:Putative glycerophosphodiester phosphodiesterase domain-containing protein n=1 Tax=Helianthus annuus TaxID=4232 RepID=A0A251SYC2_HELAN
MTADGHPLHLHGRQVDRVHILKDLLGDGTFTVDQVKFKNREKSQGVNFQGKYLE